MITNINQNTQNTEKIISFYENKAGLGVKMGTEIGKRHLRATLIVGCSVQLKGKVNFLFHQMIWIEKVLLYLFIK